MRDVKLVPLDLFDRSEAEVLHEAFCRGSH